MNIVATFDPSLALSGRFNSEIGIGGSIVIYNESNINLLLTFADNSTNYLPAWTAILHTFSNLANTVVQWSQQSTLQSDSTPPISQIVVEAYQPNEKIPGTYPAALVRQTNIQNTLVFSAQNLINGSHAAGYWVVQANVLGENQNPSTIVTNDGQIYLGTSLHPGVIQLTGADGSSVLLNFDSGFGLIVDHGLYIEGVVQADSFTANNASTLPIINANLITALSGNDIGNHVQSGNHIVNTVGGTNVWRTGSGGADLLSGTLSLLSGSISRVGVFTGSANATITHGWGVTPTMAIISYAGNFGTPPSQVPAWYNATSTQISVHAQSGYSWSMLLIAN